MTTPKSRLPIYKQPFIHFMLGGLAIFLFSSLRGESSAGDDKIIVTVPQVERMAGLWTQTWQRPPSEAELQGLVRDHIKEEVYYREALKLGLDVNDTVIRRRLRQKMEFTIVPDDAVSIPSDDDLRAYLDSNRDKYMRGAVYDFKHIYFTQENLTKAESAFANIDDNLPIGDQIGLPPSMEAADERAIGRLFGAAFYTKLGSAPKGEWFGPVESGFGYHLVYIFKTVPPILPPLAEIRKTVSNDWQNEKRLAAQQAAFEDLLANYDVRIEAPDE